MILWRKNSLEALWTVLPCCDHWGDVRKKCLLPLQWSISPWRKRENPYEFSKGYTISVLLFLSVLKEPDRSMPAVLEIISLCLYKQKENTFSQTRHHMSNYGTSSSSISWLPASPTLNIRTLFYDILDFSCTAFLHYVHINNAERTSAHTGALQYRSTLTWVFPIPSFCYCSLMHQMSLELLAYRRWQRSFHCQLT